MWIKTKLAPPSVINTDTGIEIGINQERDHYQIIFVYPRLDSNGRNFLYKEVEIFGTYEDANKYLNKLAEKLGAEVIDIDKD